MTLSERGISMEARIKRALVDKGIMLESWRMKIVGREVVGRSDWGRLTVEIYQPRKRKPCITWELAINLPRGHIHWDKSKFW